MKVSDKYALFPCAIVGQAVRHLGVLRSYIYWQRNKLKGWDLNARFSDWWQLGYKYGGKGSAIQSWLLSMKYEKRNVLIWHHGSIQEAMKMAPFLDPRVIERAKKDFDRTIGEGLRARRHGNLKETNPYPYEESEPPGYILAVGWSLGWEAWNELQDQRMENAILREYVQPCSLCRRIIRVKKDGSLYDHRCEVER